jgi:hypothetical protein
MLHRHTSIVRLTSAIVFVAVPLYFVARLAIIATIH